MSGSHYSDKDATERSQEFARLSDGFGLFVGERPRCRIRMINFVQ
jgi:hypothetical protein